MTNKFLNNIYKSIKKGGSSVKNFTKTQLEALNHGEKVKLLYGVGALTVVTTTIIIKSSNTKNKKDDINPFDDGGNIDTNGKKKKKKKKKKKTKKKNKKNDGSGNIDHDKQQGEIFDIVMFEKQLLKDGNNQNANLANNVQDINDNNNNNLMVKKNPIDNISNTSIGENKGNSNIFGIHDNIVNRRTKKHNRSKSEIVDIENISMISESDVFPEHEMVSKRRKDRKKRRKKEKKRKKKKENRRNNHSNVSDLDISDNGVMIKRKKRKIRSDSTSNKESISDKEIEIQRELENNKIIKKSDEFVEEEKEMISTVDPSSFFSVVLGVYEDIGSREQKVTSLQKKREYEETNSEIYNIAKTEYQPSNPNRDDSGMNNSYENYEVDSARGYDNSKYYQVETENEEPDYSFNM